MSDKVEETSQQDTAAGGTEGEEVAPGYKYLLKGDLDPGAQTETEDTETEQPPDTGTGEQDTDGEPPKVKEETETDEAPPKDQDKPDEKDTGEKPREYQGIKVGDKVYQDEAALVAAYQSAEGLVGRQGHEMGELRAKIAELEGQVPKLDGSDDSEPEYDPLDKEKVDTWNGWNTRRIMRQIRAEQKQADDKRQMGNQVAAQAANQAEIQTFLEANQDLSVGDLLTITRLVGEDGMSYKDALSKIGNGQTKPPAKPAAEEGAADKLTKKKQDAADEGGKNLSEGGGAAKTGVDLDSLSPEEWGERKKTMTKAQIEAHLAGEDID